jgi:hypothetical protein
MSKEAMREEAERLVREAMQRKAITVKQGDTRIEAKCGKMCGRFSRDYTWAQIQALYSLTSTASNVQPNYYVCPTTNIDVYWRLS